MCAQNKGFNALLVAASQDTKHHLAIARLLVEHGAELDVQPVRAWRWSCARRPGLSPPACAWQTGFDRRTALHLSAERDDLAAVRRLLTHGAAQLSAADSWGATALLHLSGRGHSGDVARDDERLRTLQMLLAKMLLDADAKAAIEHRAPRTETTPPATRRL